MHLVQILLPVYGNDGEPLLHSTYASIRDELVGKFGGLTAFTQSPAEGVWTPDHNQTQRDEVIMIEVMTPVLDVAWWSAYREGLERRLKQQSVVVRCLGIRTL